MLQDLGDLAGARTQLERALQISEAALGPDHPDVGTWRNNLGLVLQDLGDLTGARTQLERALQISEAALGPDHPDIGIRRNNLGSVLQDLGDLAGARTQLERALQISEAALGPDHPQTTPRAALSGSFRRAHRNPQRRNSMRSWSHTVRTCSPGLARARRPLHAIHIRHLTRQLDAIDQQ